MDDLIGRTLSHSDPRRNQPRRHGGCLPRHGSVAAARGGAQGAAARARRRRRTPRPLHPGSAGRLRKLLVDLSHVCAQFHDQAVRGLRSKRIECDEIWQFCYAKAKNVPEAKRDTFGFGDVWTWTALDSTSKLIVSWLVGPRDAGSVHTLMQDVASRIRTRVQLTTDGNRVYLERG